MIPHEYPALSVVPGAGESFLVGVDLDDAYGYSVAVVDCGSRDEDIATAKRWAQLFAVSPDLLSIAISAAAALEASAARREPGAHRRYLSDRAAEIRKTIARAMGGAA